MSLETESPHIQFGDDISPVNAAESDEKNSYAVFRNEAAIAEKLAERQAEDDAEAFKRSADHDLNLKKKQVRTIQGVASECQWQATFSSASAQTCGISKEGFGL